MIFIQNKYTSWYNQIIESAKLRKLPATVYSEVHHIMPRSLNGSNHQTNLVTLTAREHYICHKLLVKMTSGRHRQRMSHAYWAMVTLIKDNQHRYMNSVIYESAKRVYAQLMSAHNPMHDEAQKERMRNVNSNPHCNAVVVKNQTFPSIAAAARAFNTTPHLFKRDHNYTREINLNAIINRVYPDKFGTPFGTFKTKRAMQKALTMPEYILNVIYNNLDQYPTCNGRRSKIIGVLDIDHSKTWRENGFYLVDSLPT